MSHIDTKSVAYRFFHPNVILTSLDGWVIEKKYVVNKSKNQTNYSFCIKAFAQILASTKKRSCIENPVKYLRRSSSGELEGLPDPHLG